MHQQQPRTALKHWPRAQAETAGISSGLHAFMCRVLCIGGAEPPTVRALMICNQQLPAKIPCQTQSSKPAPEAVDVLRRLDADLALRRDLAHAPRGVLQHAVHSLQLLGQPGGRGVLSYVSLRPSVSVYPLQHAVHALQLLRQPVGEDCLCLSDPCCVCAGLQYAAAP